MFEGFYVVYQGCCRRLRRIHSPCDAKSAYSFLVRCEVTPAVTNLGWRRWLSLSLGC